MLGWPVRCLSLPRPSRPILETRFEQQSGQEAFRRLTHSECMRQTPRKKDDLSACTTRRMSSTHIADPAWANNVVKAPNLSAKGKKNSTDDSNKKRTKEHGLGGRRDRIAPCAQTAAGQAASKTIWENRGKSTTLVRGQKHNPEVYVPAHRHRVPRR